MTMTKKVPTNCRFCGYQCGLIAHVDNNNVTKVEPDPTRFPYDTRVQNRCPRWRVIPQVLDHPKRINYPLKRKGSRGSGQWEKITWEQALDEIAAKLQALKDKYGPETLATCIGGPHAIYWPLHRFMNLFGSPNNVGVGQICWNPGILINTLTFGWPVVNELNPETTNCALVWGTNPAQSDNSLFWHSLLQLAKAGKPLIVVDPRCSQTARQATLWLPVRPGTDAFLALGLIHVIIQEKLYDSSFVNRWCYGFEQLKKHVKPYTPGYVAGITGIPAEDIVKAAQLYAGNSPATLYTGRGIDQLGYNTIPTHQAFAILRAITGNVDVPGASYLTEMPDFIPEIDLEMSEHTVASFRKKQLGQDFLSLQTYQGYAKLRQYTMKHDKRLPMRYLTSAHPNLVWKAMITGQPYPIKALIVMATNPLLTQADTGLVYQALKSLDLLVVLELFETPTAMLADYILPSAGVLERPLMETDAGTANVAYGGKQAVTPYYQRRQDYFFWRELGLRFGQQDYWPWETMEEALDDCLKPTGLTWQEFCETGLYYRPHRYAKYETAGENNRPLGFATESGKVELYSNLLDHLGYPPLPQPKQPPPATEEFPLRLITGARIQPYYASSYRQVTELRALHPEPLAEISPTTAQKYGLEEGSWIQVVTKKGKGRFKLKFRSMRDNVVSIEYGWWFPEMKNREPELGGLWLSNANNLTSADFAACEPLIGTWNYNGIPCRIEKAVE
ncbi:MAG: molybdopterin-dependent oxidoreductase [Clostridia bacterium]|nr:molybdopterin-dependent oxidoreductase [Clostridia bacterium]